MVVKVGINGFGRLAFRRVNVEGGTRINDLESVMLALVVKVVSAVLFPKS